MAADSIVRARIDAKSGNRAAAALEEMGLTISDAIRLLLVRVADEKRLPFEVKAPNAKTRDAMQELMQGKGKRSASSAVRSAAPLPHKAAHILGWHLGLAGSTGFPLSRE